MEKLISTHFNESVRRGGYDNEFLKFETYRQLNVKRDGKILLSIKFDMELFNLLERSRWVMLTTGQCRTTITHNGESLNIDIRSLITNFLGVPNYYPISDDLYDLRRINLAPKKLNPDFDLEEYFELFR